MDDSPTSYYGRMDGDKPSRTLGESIMDDATRKIINDCLDNMLHQVDLKLEACRKAFMREVSTIKERLPKIESKKRSSKEKIADDDKQEMEQVRKSLKAKKLIKE
jgi:hypothetical protein